MNHFIEKNNFICGSDPKSKAIDAYVGTMNNYFDNLPKPETPILRPPSLGENQFIKSYTTLEIIDCLSDGPIAGLVYQDINGVKIIDSNNYFYAIYLDEIAVGLPS